MTIEINPVLTIDQIGLASGRVYRVGDQAVIIDGNRISSVNDDGVVFSALEYEPAPGGFGRVTPYYVHDNGDGTMNIYFRLTEGLPQQNNDLYMTLDAKTGAKIGATKSLPYWGDNPGNMGHTNGSGQADGQLLQQAITLSDGTIALVDTSNILNQFVFKIVNPDGTPVALSTSIGSGVFSHGQQLLFDMTEVGDTVAIAWAESDPRATGAPVSLRIINKDGSFAGDEITLGNDTSRPFGNTPAVQLETLSDGRILVVWVENGTSSGPDTDQTSTWFSILNPNGTEAVAPTLVNQEVIKAREDTPLVITTEDGFVIGYSVLDFAGTQVGRLKEYDLSGTLLDTETAAYTWGIDDIVRTDNNTAFVIGGNIYEIDLPGDDTPLGGGGGSNTGTTKIGTGGRDTLNGTAGDDELVGKGGNDKLFGRNGADELSGNLGADTLEGGNGGDTLDGGNGRDRLKGQKGDDLALGGDGNDVLSGGKGSDTLEGGKGNDRINGDAGKDKLSGARGRDTLEGGDGNDTLTGGNGPDTFVMRPGTGTDRITDFDVDVDTLQIAASLANGRSEAEIADLAKANNGKIFLDLGDGKFVLQNTPASVLDQLEDAIQIV